MELTDLGFDGWFEQRAASVLGVGQGMARVTAVDRGGFLIRSRGAEQYAELAGKLRFETEAAMDLPCVGDWVCAQWPASEGPVLIHAVVPRKTHLRRKRASTGEFQMLASNIDVAFIVQGCDYDFNMDRLERYLMMAAEGQTEARIVLSKTDMVSPVELEQRVAQLAAAGFSVPTIPLSNVSGVGVDDFRALLGPGKTYCLLGSSGVGKTTLINRLIGRNAFETKAVGGSGEGVHTTTRRHLLVLEGGAMLIDTPGMREPGVIGASEAVQDNFADVSELALNCRFSNCSHGQEPGCAILQALTSGSLSEKRYRSYLKLEKEANVTISPNGRSGGRTRKSGRSAKPRRRS